jgi:hypothetical protein
MAGDGGRRRAAELVGHILRHLTGAEPAGSAPRELSLGDREIGMSKDKNSSMWALLHPSIPSFICHSVNSNNHRKTILGRVTKSCSYI